MSMDTRQRIARATRFFARPVAFDLECPRCGTVYQCKQSPPAPKQSYWDPTTARFKCTAKAGCGMTFIIGIVAWPITAAPKVASQTPSDQVPNERQLSQLRKEGGGFWLADEAAQRYPRPSETNLTDGPRPDREDEDDE